MISTVRSTSGVQYVLWSKTSAFDDSLDVFITDGKEAYSTMMCAKNSKPSSIADKEKWWSDLLTSIQEPDNRHEFNIAPKRDGCELAVYLKASSKTKILLVKCSLTALITVADETSGEDQSSSVMTMFTLAGRELKSQRELVSDLRRENEVILAQNRALQTDMLAYTGDKDAWQNDVFRKMCLLINSKKREITRLEALLKTDDAKAGLVDTFTCVSGPLRVGAAAGVASATAADTSKKSKTKATSVATTRAPASSTAAAAVPAAAAAPAFSAATTRTRGRPRKRQIVNDASETSENNESEIDSEIEIDSDSKSESDGQWYEELEEDEEEEDENSDQEAEMEKASKRRRVAPKPVKKKPDSVRSTRNKRIIGQLAPSSSSSSSSSSRSKTTTPRSTVSNLLLNDDDDNDDLEEMYRKIANATSTEATNSTGTESTVGEGSSIITSVQANNASSQQSMPSTAVAKKSSSLLSSMIMGSDSEEEVPTQVLEPSSTESAGPSQTGDNAGYNNFASQFMM